MISEQNKQLHAHDNFRDLGRSLWKTDAKFSDLFAIDRSGVYRYHIVQAEDGGVAYTLDAGPDGSPAPYFPCDDTFVVGSGMHARYTLNGKGVFFRKLVTPSDELMEYIRRSMFPIAGDTIYFEASFWETGSILMSAKNNKILASRWLAVFDIDNTGDAGLREFLGCFHSATVIKSMGHGGDRVLSPCRDGCPGNKEECYV